ncbi:MAG: glycosyltransferase [bacterium]
MSRRPSFGVVVLTQGRRPDELSRALRGVLGQRGVDLDVVVVGNGWEPSGLPPGVSAVGLADNVGIPAGRNAGVAHVSGDLLFFLDDDACLPDPDALARVAALFEVHTDLGVVQPRVIDPEGRPAPRRWTPRLHVGDPARSSDVTALWEGAVAIRRALFERIGGWAGEFFYAHEGIDLAWAAWDAGVRVRYQGDIVVHHPAVAPTRHADLYRLSARNRVFLARRRLPLPMAILYLLIWSVLTVSRVRGRTALRQSLRGAIEGFRGDAGPRRPMSWLTIVRMTRAGRPPLI